MKKFKELLAEAGEQDAFGRYAVGYSPSVIAKINAVIGAYCAEETSDPYTIIYRIRGSLNNLGLTFDDIDDDAMIESKGTASYSLTAFGGRFGKDLDTPHNEFLNDDGLSHIIEGGLSLHISYEKTDTNQCRLRAHIE